MIHEQLFTHGKTYEEVASVLKRFYGIRVG